MGTGRVRLDERLTVLLLWLNLAGALAAVVTNARAAASPHPRDRFEFGAACTLAVIFTAAIVAQLVWDDPPWSRDLARSVGLAAWPFVWCWPAIATVRRQRRPS